MQFRATREPIFRTDRGQKLSPVEHQNKPKLKRRVLGVGEDGESIIRTARGLVARPTPLGEGNDYIDCIYTHCS